MIREIINLEKLSRDGFKQPANNPATSIPDNITHAQLRYNDFSSSNIIQGTAVYNYPSTFEFEISSAVTNSYQLFKLFTSDDGTTYSENKSYGGDDGISLSGLNSDLLATNNTWTGTNAFNTSLPTSSLNPTTANQMSTLKSSGLSYAVTLSQVGSSAPTKSRENNPTGTTATIARLGTGLYRLRFGTNIFALYKYNVQITQISIDQNGSVFGFVAIDYLSITGGDIFINTYGYSGIESGALTLDDSILADTNLLITFYPL